MLSLKDETLSYKNINVLENISLTINEGEKVAILGKSGSGKSTLLKRFYELKKEEVSYLPQSLGLVENLSSYHNIYSSSLQNNSSIYNLINLIKPFKKDLQKVEKILEDLECKDKLLTKVFNLSGGQKQRIAIAKTVFANKKILLADEPISALDEHLSKKTLDFLNDSFDTFICAVHNVDLAISSFDRIIGIKNQKIILDKKSSQLTAQDRDKLYHVLD
jgi:phosphonate transport system ATP-binding protein